MVTSIPRTPKVFLDSSVFFAAAYSDRGSAHDLLVAAVEGRVSLVLSRYVLTETERNLWESAPRFYLNFLRFRDEVPYHLSDPSPQLIAETERIVVAKDAPVIAAARAARASLVASRAASWGVRGSIRPGPSHSWAFRATSAPVW